MLRREAARWHWMQLRDHAAKKTLFPIRRLCPAGYNNDEQLNLPILQYAPPFLFYYFLKFMNISPPAQMLLTKRPWSVFRHLSS